MAISKKQLEREIKAVEAALKAHREGIDINELVLDAFKMELNMETFDSETLMELGKTKS